MDDFYRAMARERQRDRHRQAQQARLARVAKRAARQQAAREAGGAEPPQPVSAPAARRRAAHARAAAGRARAVALRRTVGYALLRAGLRLLAPPSHASPVEATESSEPASARGPSRP